MTCSKNNFDRWNICQMYKKKGFSFLPSLKAELKMFTIVEPVLIFFYNFMYISQARVWGCSMIKTSPASVLKNPLKIAEVFRPIIFQQNPGNATDSSHQKKIENS